MFAVPPSPTRSRGARTRAIASPSARLECIVTSSRDGSNGMICAASTTAASATRPASASAVPSPPSASGSSSHSTPASAKPAASAAAASRAARTALRLSGQASARGLCILVRLRGAHLRLVGSRHHLEHRERQALAREEEQPDPDSYGCLDRLETEAERDAVRVGDVVTRLERRGDRDLYEADVPRPEREDGCD